MGHGAIIQFQKEQPCVCVYAPADPFDVVFRVWHQESRIQVYLLGCRQTGVQRNSHLRKRETQGKRVSQSPRSTVWCIFFPLEDG